MAETIEYCTLLGLRDKLRIGFKKNMETLADNFLRKGLIDDKCHEIVTTTRSPITERDKVDEMLKSVMESVKLSDKSYYTMIEILSQSIVYKHLIELLNEEYGKTAAEKHQHRRGSLEIPHKKKDIPRPRYYSESELHCSTSTKSPYLPPLLESPTQHFITESSSSNTSDTEAVLPPGKISRKRFISNSSSKSLKHPRTESVSSTNSSDTEMDSSRRKGLLTAKLPEFNEENVKRVFRQVKRKNLRKLQSVLLHSQEAQVMISIINDCNDYFLDKHNGTATFWFKTNEPSWDQLYQALKACNEKDLADNLEQGAIFESLDPVDVEETRSRTIVKVPRCSYGDKIPIPSPETKEGKAIVTKSLEDLQRGFQDLMYDISELLLDRNIEFARFIKSASRYFSPQVKVGIDDINDFFEKMQSCDKLSMWHYDDLESTLTRIFGKSDKELATIFNEYETKLTNYLTTAKIIEFLKSNDKEQILSRSTRTAEFDIHEKSGYKSLGEKIDTTVEEKSLDYILDLWQSLQKWYHLTQANVVLEDIKDGCLEITWIVPDEVADTVLKQGIKARDYFHSEQVRLVWINGECIYNEDIHAKEAEDIHNKEAEMKANLALSLACENGRTIEVNALLQAPNIDINHPSIIDGKTPLMLAAMSGHVEIVENLLKRDELLINKTEDSLGWSALFFAAKMEHKAVAEKLLENGANILMADKNGSTVLDIAPKLSPTSQYLNKVTKAHHQFFKACKDGDLQQVNAQLKIKATNIDTIRSDGKTPIMLAAQYGHVEVIKCLLKHEPNVLISDPHGAIAVDLAKDFPNAIECLKEETMMASAAQGKIEVVRKLLDLKTDPNIRESDEYEYTALLWACLRGRTEVLKLLLKYGADPRAESKKTSWNGLLLACRYKHYDIAKILLEHYDIEKTLLKEKFVNKKTVDGWTALMLVAADGNREMAELLLDHGANPELKDEKGFTPFIQAAQDGHLEIIKLLVERNPHVAVDKHRTESPNDWSAVMFATKNGHIKIVEYLAQKGANLHRQKEDGISVLHIAAYHGHTKLVHYLCLHEKLYVDVQDEDGMTPLMYSARTGHLEVAKILRQKLAKVNIQENIFCWTAPFFAMLAKNQSILDFLLECGIDWHHEDLMGNNLLDLSLLFNRRAYRSIKAKHTAEVAAKKSEAKPARANNEYDYVTEADNNIWNKKMKSRLECSHNMTDARKIVPVY